MTISVLLADDHNFVREGLRSLLKRLRYLAYPSKEIPD